MSATVTTTSEALDCSIIAIDELQNYGINASDIQKLKGSGIYTVNTVQSTTRRNLVNQGTQ